MVSLLKRMAGRFFLPAVLLLLCISPLYAQAGHTDIDKIKNEIAGEWKFNIQGLRDIIYCFTVEDGKLLGAAKGKEKREELVPAAGGELEFSMKMTGSKMSYLFKFSKDTNGSITICLLTINPPGMKAEGSKTDSGAKISEAVTEINQETLYREISGDWIFGTGKMITRVKFFVKQGKLICTSEKDPKEKELKRLTGKIIVFETEDNIGTLTFKFFKDSKGHITKGSMSSSLFKGLNFDGSKNLK